MHRTTPQDARPAGVRAVVLDLDGVVWLSGIEIAGSADAVARLRSAGVAVRFATNNSAPRLSDHEAALAAIGIPAAGDVVTAAQAAALLVEPGERAMVVGGFGLHEALDARGAQVLDPPEAAERGADVVVAGLDRAFTYDTLRVAAGVVRRGARLVASNDDATYPTPDGPIPGGGAMVAAIATAAGVAPIVAGKPHQPMADLVLLSIGGQVETGTVVMVGDRPETDGLFAARLGAAYAQVRSGVLPAGHPVPAGVHPAIDVADLASVADILLSRAQPPR